MAPNQFNALKRKCGIIENYQTNLDRPKLLNGGLSRAEHEDNYAENKLNNPKIQDCPVDKPYFDGYKCIVCTNSQPYFNLNFKECQNCPDNSVYS